MLELRLTELGFSTSCVGLNDERGVGACALSLKCTRGGQLFDRELAELGYGVTDPLTCLVIRDRNTDELWDWGWYTRVEACRQYRSLYPDRFDCRSVNWASIP